MKTTAEHPLVTSYLREFDEAAINLTAARQLELREEIASHLREAVPAGLSMPEATAAISDFGSPAEILGHELPAERRNTSWSPNLRRVLAFTAAAVAVGAMVVTAWFLVLAPAPTSVVNSNPEGPERIQEGTAYYEYLAAIEAMPDPLPAGAEFPDGIPAGLDTGPFYSGGSPDAEDGTVEPDGIMEAGAGRNVAYFTWLCAWEGEYLAAFDEGDAERQVDAAAMLSNFPGYQLLGGTEADWAQAVLAPMNMGDPSGVRVDYPQMCGQAFITNVDSEQH
jgi:hypothetical protein